MAERDDAEAVVFAGPSSAGLPARCWRGLQARPPARRGSIAQLVETWPGRPVVLVLADGVFGAEPAVSHAELCQALDAGWRVWGCSSLGAIRAWEMRHEGMRGHGWVFSQLSLHEDITDDEMALLHLPLPPWEVFSVPLVNLRHALWERGDMLGISGRAQRRLIGWLKQTWFGDRTPTLLLDLLCGPLRVPAPAALTLMAHLGRRPVKNLDLHQLLQRRPWRQV